MQCSRCDTDWPTGAPNCPGCGAFADEPPPLLDLDAPSVAEPAEQPMERALSGAAGAPFRRPEAAPERPTVPAALPADLPRGVDRYRELLRERFGYPDFRPGQAEVLERLADGDVLGVMPTGGGKSLCYVLPALEVGRALVVSPLIALMQDQVEALQAAGVAADYINSTLSAREQNRRYVDFTEGRTALLYIAPERLANRRFVAGLQRHGVRLLVIDEAHCISEWGHDFRPDYLAIGVARAQLGEPRTLALTATADATVRRDILARLGITGANEVLTSFDRPNLRFAAQQMDAAGDRLDWLVRYAREREGQSGIIYARTRRNVEETAAALRAAGIRAEQYHAGMPGSVRASTQRRFTTGQTPIIVATNAFGLGIDKPDVRFVVHLGMPGRLESYYQEAGRAGRDGEPAECTLLYARRDIGLQRRFISQAHPDEEQVRRAWHRLVELQRFAGDRPMQSADAADAGGGEGWPVTLAALRASGLVEPGALRLATLDPHASIDTSAIEERRRYAESRLAQMVEYAETTGCRRGLVLRYFGEEPGEADCGGCDNCTQTTRRQAPEYPGELFDAILDLRTRIARDSGRPPYTVFEERTAREVATYRPRDESELLATWGMGETRVRWFGAELLALVRAWEAEHRDAPAPPPRPEPKSSSRRRAAEAQEAGPEVAFDDPLYERLRDWRRERSRSEGVPAYTFFTDRSARELAARRPESREALLGVWGLGDARVEAFGDDLLALIRDHCGDGSAEPAPDAPASALEAQMPLAVPASGGHA
ncbi:MAG: RecQ family ATP-dependent DNA helicase [Chloroflexi bacterium]|nr:RecQ family ATP-dependent DNA helicase [Chloroflexota bacterium]